MTQPATASVHLTPRVDLLTRESADKQLHQTNFQEAVSNSMLGFAASVQQLSHSVTASSITAQQAASSAKQDFISRIHTAVADSIGYRRRRSGNTRKCKHAVAWNADIAAAVQQKKQAAQLLADARKALSTLASASPQTATTSAMSEVQAAETACLQAQRHAKKATAAAKAAAKDAQVARIDSCRRQHDTAGMWTALYGLCGKTKSSDGPAALQTAEGVLCVEDEQNAHLLAQHYQRATNPAVFAAGADFDEQHAADVEAAVATFRTTTSYVETGPAELSSGFTGVEVAVATKRLQNRKTPSPLDDVNNELLKYGGEAMHDALAVLYDLQWSVEYKAQTPGVIRSLLKRGDDTIVNNYRPITLGATVDKLYNTMLNARITKYLEANGKLHDAQQAFRPGRCTADNILMLDTLLRGRLKQKLTTYLLFLDIEKAYDSVWRAGLLWHVWHSGIQGKMFRVLAQMCDCPKSMVLHRGHYSAEFQPGMGWEQGDTLATTMFNIHVNAVLSAVWEKHTGVSLPGALLKLVALMFADDFVGVAGSADDLQSLINIVRAELTRWRIKASVSTTDNSKTAVMVVKANTRQGGSTGAEWKWGEVTLPVVSMYKYLGVTLSDTAKWDMHVATRLEKATNACRALSGVLYNNKLAWKVRKTALLGAVMPVACYAAEVWNNPTQTDRKKLDSWQMNTVSAMIHCPATASHACLQQELGIQPMHVACDVQMLNYWHRVQRMHASRLVRQVQSAFTGMHNPWQRRIGKLLQEYHIDAALAPTMSRAQFKKYVRLQAAARTNELWTQRQQRGSSVQERYVADYGMPAQSSSGVAQHYITHLSSIGLGYAAELCLKLRCECMHLNGMHLWQRQVAAAHQQRFECPCCHAAVESRQHFLLECSTTQAARQQLFDRLHSIDGQLLNTFRSLPIDQQTRQLLNPAFWEGRGDGVPGRWTAFIQIASFIVTAWKARSIHVAAALNGRETNGREPRV